MREKGLSQSQLSRLSGVSQAGISAYLLGKRLPGVSEFARLALALGVSMDYLWGIADAQRDDNALREENIQLRAALQLAIGSLEGAVVTLKKSL